MKTKSKSSEGKGIKVKPLIIKNGIASGGNYEVNQKSLDKKKHTEDNLVKSYKKTKELGWEKEFDNDCWDTKDGVMTVTYLMKGGNKVGKLTERVTKEMIKSYVKIRLTQQRTELLEQILNLECLKEEKLIDDTKVDCMILEKTWEDNDLKVIRNNLRKEIIEEINKL